MQTAAPSNWHTIIDARSRDLHAIIAGKIRLHPSVLGQVCKTLARWLRAMYKTDLGRDALVEWQRKLEDQPLDEVLEFPVRGKSHDLHHRPDGRDEGNGSATGSGVGHRDCQRAYSALEDFFEINPTG